MDSHLQFPYVTTAAAVLLWAHRVGYQKAHKPGSDICPGLISIDGNDAISDTE